MKGTIAISFVVAVLTCVAEKYVGLGHHVAQAAPAPFTACK